MRAILIALLCVAVAACAQGSDDHQHRHHVAEAGGIRAIHGWANATAGSTAFVFVEIENTLDEPVALTGAETNVAQAAELVGFANIDGELAYVPIPRMPILPRSRVVLSPNGLAIRLTGLSQRLVEGGHFDVAIALGDLRLEVVVEVESATATRHSHAGHVH